MEWYERFGVALHAFGDAANSGWDLIHSLFPGNHDETRDALDLLLRVPLGIGSGVAQGIGGVAQGFMEGDEWVNDQVNRVAATPLIAANLQGSPIWMQNRQGFSGTTLDADTWKQAWELAKDTSVGQALQFNSRNLLDFIPSLGQPSYGDPKSYTDILDRKKVAELKDSVMFNVSSGLTDAAFSWYTDPIGGALKTVGAANRVRKGFQVGAGPNDPWLEQLLFKRTKIGYRGTADELADSDRVSQFLAWAAGRSARQIMRHPMIAAMAQKDDAAGILASLLHEQDFGTARKVIALGFGSEKAQRELLAERESLASVINGIEGKYNIPYFSAILQKNETGQWLGPTAIESTKPLAIAPASTSTELALSGGLTKTAQDKQAWDANLKLQGELNSNVTAQMADNADKRLRILTAAVGEHSKASGIWMGMINRVPMQGDLAKTDRLLAYDAASRSPFNETLIGNPLGIPLKVMSWASMRTMHSFTDKRPPKWIDFNRKDTSGALVAYMRTSKAFTEDQINANTSKYLNALDIPSRAQVVEDIEKQAIRQMAALRGIPQDEADLLAKESIGRRNTLVQKLRTQQAQGQVFGTFDDNGTVIRIPLFESQQIDSRPLLDLEAFNDAFKKHTSFLRAIGIARKTDSPRKYLDDAFESLYGLWSATALLRAGYTLRNLTDDTLRSIASLGMMDFVGRMASGVKAGIGQKPFRTRISNVGKRKEALKDALQIKREGPTPYDIARAVEGRIDQMGRDLGSVRVQGNLGNVYDGRYFNAPYENGGEIMQRLVGGSHDNLSNSNSDFLAHLRNAYSSWDQIGPLDRGHTESWITVMHNQISNSQIGRKFLEGLNSEQVKRWLISTGEGRATLRNMRRSAKDADQIVGDAQAMIDYVVPLMRDHANPWILRHAAFRKEVTPQMLDELFPTQELRPVVHGPTIDLGLSTGTIADVLDKVTNFGFKWFGQVPTDKLVRHPVFRSMYIGNTRRMYENLKRQIGFESITGEDLDRIEHAAREMSLKQLNGLLFDGTNKSIIAHRLRFLTGFYSAWEDSITKWAKLAGDKPELLVKGAKLWNSPSEMNLGSTEDPVTGMRVPRFQALKLDNDPKSSTYGEFIPAGKNWNPLEINDEVYLQARLPAFLKKLPWLEDIGDVKIAKSSMNLILQGDPWWLPGAGPLANMAVSQYALKNPTTLRDVYKWAIPYGPEENVIYGLLPAWARRLWTSDESITDQSKAAAWLMIAQAEATKIRLHKKPAMSEADFLKDVNARTDSFFKLRAFTSFFAPFTVQFDTPYQFYADQYRALKTKEGLQDIHKQLQEREASGKWVPVTADEQFLERYGEDFYSFTTSLSKNNSYLPPSVEAWRKSQGLEAEIGIDPEVAALKMGKIADTAFDQYVYQAQFHQDLGNGKMAREHQAPQDAIKANETRLGWIHFTQMQDALDAYQNVLPAEFLDMVRKKLTDQMATTNDEQGRPVLNAWGKDYYQTDQARIPDRINRFTRFIQDNEQLVRNRPDLQVLQNYLAARKQLVGFLAKQKEAGLPSTLNAEANKSIAQWWKNFQNGAAESNTQFGLIFWRYLSNDKLQTNAVDT